MRRIIKLCSALLAFTTLLLCVSAIGGTSDAPAVSEDFADGVYTIKSVANKKHLNALDTEYTASGYAYTDTYTGESGEHIRITRAENGGFLLYPQSEDGKYAFHAESQDENAHICKSEELTELSYFDIQRDGDAYVILLHGTNRALSVGGKKTLFRKQLAELRAYEGEDAQKWIVEPVSSSFELKTVAEKVNVNSVSAVYAVVTPSYMKGKVSWSSSDESVVLMDDDGSFCALSEGKATVTASIDDMTQSIEIEVVDSPAYTWYSQHLSTDGGWHGGELSKVYFSAGASKRFIIDRYNRGLDWMDEGCAITSVAMVLHNLGARYGKGYDFRFDADGALEADPYTVALANTGNRGLTKSSGTLYYNPIMMNLRQITAGFTLFGRKLTFNQSYTVSKKIIKEALDTHPEGVIVHMRSKSESHYIVIAACVNPEAENPADYQFVVYDSAAQARDEGDGVLFEKSISYDTLYYRYGSMSSIITFDFAEEE